MVPFTDVSIIHAVINVNGVVLVMSRNSGDVQKRENISFVNVYITKLFYDVFRRIHSANLNLILQQHFVDFVDLLSTSSKNFSL